MTQMRWLMGGLWAGVISAAICYAEYVGLGALLASGLIGYGDQSKAVGTLLVVLAASITCLFLSLCRAPYLAGPRAASLSILVLALITLQANSPTSGPGQLAILAALMLGCATMLFAGSKPKVQAMFDALPPWLVPAFTYASAISIIASATSKYLHSCLLLSNWQAWGIFLGGTCTGLLWLTLCRRITPDTTVKTLLNSLQSISLLVGTGVAWMLYEASTLTQATAGMCARLGLVQLQVDALHRRIHHLFNSSVWDVSGWALCQALLWGIFVGMVLCIETRTTVDSLVKKMNSAGNSTDSVRQPESSALTMNMARTAAVLAPATLVPSSLSHSRTVMLWGLSRPSSWAVFVHAVALLLIAFFASHWLAWLPQIALAVLMTLVACSMLVEKLQDIWYRSYSPRRKGIEGALGLWLVITIAVWSGYVMLGFVIPAICFGAYRIYRARDKRST